MAPIALALGLFLSGSAMGQPASPAGDSRSPVPLAPASSPTPGRRVLLVYTETRLTPYVVAVDTELRSTLERRSTVPLTFYTEYLDTDLFDGATPRPELRGLLRLKYEHRPIDLIVAASTRALRVALHNRAELFANAPVVFVSVDPSSAADLRLDADVTGTWLRMGWAATLDLARRLEPGIRRAVVVTGSPPIGRVWMAEARRQLEAVRGTVEVTYLTDLSVDDVLSRVAEVPKNTVILVGAFLRDATGRDFMTREVITRIADHAKVPVYGLFDDALGTGAVGGQVMSFKAHGRAAAELALRVLAGERPPPTDAETIVPVVDARQMERWGFDTRRLPPGSIVLFRQPSLWTQHRWYVVGAVVALLLQGGLIAALLIQRTQRRRAQDRLAERLKFETLVSDLSSRFSASSALDAEQSIQGGLQLVGEGLGVDWATVRMLEDRGDQARLAQAWTSDGVAPRPAVIREDQTPWIFARVRQGQVVRVTRASDLPDEAATDRRSLEALVMRSAAFLPLVVHRAVLGFLSVGTVRSERPWPDDLISRLQLLADVFANALDRRRATLAACESEAHIRDLAGRIMTAQEEERRRIARDLHDDVNQELAALSIALSGLGDRLPSGTTADFADELAQLDARTGALSESIRHLSHELHPGILQHVGLVAALRGYCRRFTREHAVPVTFHADGDLETVPPDIGLCLYRVVQEGLGNVAKHAGAGEARVTVEGHGLEVVLTIRDDGRGFDPLEGRSRRGLGLLSLEERVNLVGGRLVVEAQPLQGTELRIVVPLAEGDNGARDRSAG
jgi:signal transduction histidine kinase